METTPRGAFEAVTAEPGSCVWTGRIRLHTAPGEQTDRPSEVGYFFLAASADKGEPPPVQCFVQREYRTRRPAIEEALRTGALAASLPAGTPGATVRLRFHWTTPEPEHEIAAGPGVAREVAGGEPTAGSTSPTPIAVADLRPRVSYVPDTDEYVPLEKQSWWRRSGPAVMGKVVAGLAFLTGVAMVAMAMPSFIATELERPPTAAPDLVLGALVFVLSLAFLVLDRAVLMLVVGAALCMFAGGHIWINRYPGFLEVVAALLGILAGLSAVLVRRGPRPAGPADDAGRITVARRSHAA